MERAYWATTSHGPFMEGQVVVLDDAIEPDAGWIRAGWLREITCPPRLVILSEEEHAEFLRIYEARLAGLPEQLTQRPRGRRRR